MRVWHLWCRVCASQVMGHFEQTKRIFILIVNPISSCLIYVNGIGNGYRIKFICQLYPSSAKQNAYTWPIYQFRLYSLNLNPCLSQKSTINDTIMQKLYRKLFSLILKTQSHVIQAWYWRLHWYQLLENLVLHLIQNTQWKQQTRIYFIHER